MIDDILKKIILKSMTMPYTPDDYTELEILLCHYFNAKTVQFVKANDLPRSNANAYLDVKIDDQYYGYYELFNPATKRTFEEITFLEDVLSKLYSNNVDYREFYEEAYIDRATGVYNKNYYHKKCHELQQKNIEKFGCFFIDINGLHEINNTLGHEYGDTVIYSVASLLKFVCKLGIICRVGGDEFAVLLPNCSRDYSYVPKVIKDELAKKNIYISVGFARCTEKEKIMDTIKAADGEMYLDKKQYYEQLGNDRRMRK